MSKRDEVEQEEEKLDIVLLATALSDTEVLLFEGILIENEIPYLKKDKGSGEAMGIIMGFSMFGADFYVERNRFEEAANLLEAYSQPSWDDWEYDEIDDSEEDDHTEDGENE